MSDWHRTRDGLWERAWALMSGRRAHRFITLATMGARGPAARLVVLRRADAAKARVEIFTDVTSTKVGELRADPRAAIHHWVADHDLQTRLEGEITITTGETLAGEWKALNQAQRESYGVTPAPGTEIAASDDYDRTPSFDHLAKLTFTAATVDIVHLSSDHHRRAFYTRDDAWAGTWRAP